VGINTAIYTRSGGYMGIGFAVPIDMAKSIVAQLRDTGKVTRGFLGIQLNPQDMDEDMAKSFGMEGKAGVLIAEVIPDSAAEKAGLKSGDIIVELNGGKVGDNKSFRNTIALMAPGTKIKLGVFRDGKKMDVTATIGNLEGDVAAVSGGKEGDSAQLEKIGMKVRDVTADILSRLGYAQKDIEGVLIEEIEPDSPSDNGMLKPGMIILSVNRTPVKNLDQFNKAIKGAAKSKRILLRVRNPQASWFVVIRPE